MRVAMVSEHASPLACLGGVDAGGQNVHVADLGRALARHGVDVTVYTRRDDPSLPERVSMGPRLAVEHVAAGPPRAMPKDDLLPHMEAFGRELRERWGRRRPDVVHAHFWMSGLASLAAAAPLDVPVVQTYHALGSVKRRQQGDRDSSPPERLAEECRIASEVDHVIATSSDERFELARMGMDTRRATVIPCGVDLGLFRPGGPALAAGPQRHRVVVVSRLVERKGIGSLVRALSGVPNCQLVVAGGPGQARLDADPEYRRFRRIAAEAGVESRVRFLGGIDRGLVPALVRSADVVACVPWYEPFGITAVEAMACGVPVLATAVGGLMDTIVHGVTGIHVPPRRPDAITLALRELLDQPGLRAAMGCAGARRARERYGWDSVARRTLSVYRHVCQLRHGVAEER